jgi:hypothetical protein
MQFFPLVFFFICGALAIQPPLNVTDLERLSDRIVVATVTSSECRWAAGPIGGIETIVWISPSAHLKGQATDSLHLVIEGGQLGYHQTWVEDEARLTEDRRYLLFLRKNQSGDWRVIGGPQGAIELRSHRAPEAPLLKAILPNQEEGP